MNLKIQMYFNRLNVLFINRNIQFCLDTDESQIRILTDSEVSDPPVAKSSRDKYI